MEYLAIIIFKFPIPTQSTQYDPHRLQDGGSYTTNERDNCDLHGHNLNLTDQNTIKQPRLWKFQSEPYKLYNLLTN